MALTREQFKTARKKLSDESREAKKAENRLQRTLDKLSKSDPKDFQENIVHVVQGLLSAAFRTAKHTKTMESYVGRSFGDVEAMFKATKVAITEIRDDIESLKTASIINSMIIQEAIVLRRPLTIKERIGIFKDVNMDYELLEKELAKRAAAAG